MKRLLVFLFGLMVAAGAVANDSEYFTNGNQLVPIQSTNISVVKEILTVNLTNNGVTNIDVYYEFRNDGPATDILMGFEAIPPYFDDNTKLAVGPHPNIKKFVVEMNGVTLPYENAISENGLDNGINAVDKNKWEYSDDCGRHLLKSDNATPLKYAYVYSFKAHFNPGKNIVHHTYSYMESYGVGHAFWIDYKLTPATRWANKQIDDFTLRITSAGIPKHFVVNSKPFLGTDVNMWITSGKGNARRVLWDDNDDPENPHHNYYELSVRDAVVEWHVTNFSPKAELWISSADCLIANSEFVKYETSGGDPFGENMYYDCGVNFSPITWVDFAKSASMKRRIMRNLPYAVRGYKFKDKRLQKYFNSQWWYFPNPKYNPAKDKTLTKREKDIANGLFDEFIQ